MENKYFTMALCADAEGTMFNVIMPENSCVEVGDLVSFKDKDCGTADMLEIVATQYLSKESAEYRYCANMTSVVPQESVTEIYSRYYKKQETDCDNG